VYHHDSLTHLPFRPSPQVAEGPLPSEAALSGGDGSIKGGTVSVHREVRIEHHYHNTTVVVNVNQVENANFGNNYGVSYLF
jgi:hypothetical protein